MTKLGIERVLFKKKRAEVIVALELTRIDWTDHGAPQKQVEQLIKMYFGLALKELKKREEI